MPSAVFFFFCDLGMIINEPLSVYVFVRKYRIQRMVGIGSSSSCTFKEFSPSVVPEELIVGNLMGGLILVGLPWILNWEISWMGSHCSLIFGYMTSGVSATEYIYRFCLVLSFILQV